MQNTRKTLLENSSAVLAQLHRLAAVLSARQYSQPLELLNGNSIGKHYRHIIEFYQCLLTNTGVVNYDRRKRDTALENNANTACEIITELIALLESQHQRPDELIYEADFTDTGTDTVAVHTGFERELAYNIEHAVHHMAIIQIVVKHYFTEIQLEEGFGVAASTLRYQQQAHVHSNVPTPAAG